MNVAVFLNPESNGTMNCAYKVIDILQEEKACVFIEREFSEYFKGYSVSFLENSSKAFALCGMVIVIGGDGTIMRYAKQAGRYDVPVLGINGGHLGFLAGLERNSLPDLKAILRGELSIEKRMLLKITADERNNNQKIYSLNDLVVTRSSESQIIDYKISRAGQCICQCRADGVIIATPTGSTAYSLSAGGPIVDAGIECILVTPICPHSLASRPLVLDVSAEIELEYSVRATSEALIISDGQLCFKNSGVGVLRICRAEMSVRFVNSGNTGFYKNIDRKLMGRNI